jgi:hypothetical protein
MMQRHETKRVAHALGVQEEVLGFWVTDLMRQRRDRRKGRRTRR